ncbi:MAG: hypothetical protein JXB00_18385 [Bacteroidales bacterium]|nr:hypothetical protein [Bacteroidales bacterium]
MKTFFLILSLNFIVTGLFSQVITFNHTVEFTTDDAGGLKAHITVTIEKGEPGFTYMLYKGNFRGEVFIKSEPTSEKSYVFENIPEGKYFLKIEDNQKRPAGITININKDEAAKQ